MLYVHWEFWEWIVFRQCRAFSWGLHSFNNGLWGWCNGLPNTIRDLGNDGVLCGGNHRFGLLSHRNFNIFSIVLQSAKSLYRLDCFLLEHLLILSVSDASRSEFLWSFWGLGNRSHIGCSNDIEMAFHPTAKILSHFRTFPWCFSSTEQFLWGFR